MQDSVLEVCCSPQSTQSTIMHCALRISLRRYIFSVLTSWAHTPKSTNLWKWCTHLLPWLWWLFSECMPLSKLLKLLSMFRVIFLFVYQPYLNKADLLKTRMGSHRKRNTRQEFWSHGERRHHLPIRLVISGNFPDAPIQRASKK